MSTETKSSPPLQANLPPGFVFDPLNFDDLEEQIAAAHKRAIKDAAPKPSFAGVPQSDTVPTFNPTGAREDEVFRDDISPQDAHGRWRPHSEFHPGDDTPVEIYRLEERRRVETGLGLIASQVLIDNTLGDTSELTTDHHFSSTHEARTDRPENATPFVSFTSDPENLGKRLILGKGFGIAGQRDSVVVRAEVHPSRVLTRGENRSNEALLVGGLAPREFRGVYEVPDFVSTVVPANTPINVKGQTLTPEAALAYWQQPPTAPQ